MKYSYLIAASITKWSYGDKIKASMVGETCSTRGDMHGYNILVRNPEGRSDLGNVDASGRIILKSECDMC